MRLLASGIDTLNLSVRGAIRESVWELLAEMQRRARKKEPSELVSFAVTEQAFECRPYGRRGYTYWLSSPDYELILGRSTKFPEALVELHSPFLHSMGIGAALDQVERLFRLDLFAGPSKRGCRVSTCTRTCRAGICEQRTWTGSWVTVATGGPSRTTVRCSSRGPGCQASCSAGTPWWRASTTRRPRSARTASVGCPICGARTSTRARRSGGWSSSSVVRRSPTSRPRRLTR